MNKTVLILYTELAPYILRCIDALADEVDEVTLVAHPVNNEAPFIFEFKNSRVKFFDRQSLSKLDILNLLDQKKPDLIVSSGWVDKGYIWALRNYSSGGTKVVALDNFDTGDFRSRLSSLRAKALYKPIFDKAWVPGNPQLEFAKQLGFDEKNIKKYFYTADFDHFKTLNVNSTRTVFPKRFVYLGRYVDFKGINDLCNAFIELGKTEWELHCAGTGELYDQRVKGDRIRHHGFVQAAELDTFVQQGGVFVLPSWKEPWGLVVHEFASAGFPIICSNVVGSSSTFLNQGQNGFLFEPKNIQDLRFSLEKIISKTDSELFEMGKMSQKLASDYTIEKWVLTAKELLNDE